MATTRKPTKEEKKIEKSLRQLDPNYSGEGLRDLEPAVVKTRSGRTPVQLILDRRERERSSGSTFHTTKRPVSMDDHKAQLWALRTARPEISPRNPQDLQDALDIAEARLLVASILLNTPLGILETILDQVVQQPDLSEVELNRIRKNLGLLD